MDSIVPTIDELSALSGERPASFPPDVASLALAAVRLLLKYEPYWTVSCRYNWRLVGQPYCDPVLLFGMAFDICRTTGLGARDRGPLLHKLYRGPIPASLYAALAVLESGGDPLYVSTGEVAKGGLFGIPLRTAQRFDMDPWSVFDALRYTRISVEGIYLAWQSHQLPRPNVATADQLLYAALVQHYIGAPAATALFAEVGRTMVVMPSTVQYLVTRGPLDWSSLALRGLGQASTAEYCARAAAALDASRLIEGFPYAYLVGLTGSAGSTDVVPPAEGYVKHWPVDAGTDPRAAAAAALWEHPLASGQDPAALAFMRRLAPSLTPWETDLDASALRSWGVTDAYQQRALGLGGHYPVRGQILEVLVPAYVERARPGATPTPSGVPRTAAAATGRSTLLVAAVLVALGAATAGAAAYARRRARRRTGGST